LIYEMDNPNKKLNNFKRAFFFLGVCVRVLKLFLALSCSLADLDC